MSSKKIKTYIDQITGIKHYSTTVDVHLENGEKILENKKRQKLKLYGKIDSTVWSSLVGSAAYLNLSNIVNGNDLFFGRVPGIKRQNLCFNSLKTIILPKDLIGIDSNLFGSTKISGIELPEGLQYIGDSSFRNCRFLEIINIPGSVIRIGNSAFCFCEKLKKIILSEGIRYIDDFAFHSSKSFVEIVLPNSLNSIGKNAFSGTNIKEIKIPHNVRINEGIFSACFDLTSVVLPANITEIPAFLFQGCRSLMELEIPETVTKIGKSAFSGLKIKTINIPNCVRDIDSYAFSNCTQLKKIIIPYGIDTLKDDLFSGCVMLEEVILPETIFSFGNSVFSRCNALKTIEIPKGVRVLTRMLFYLCRSLEQIVIPDSVERISDQCFYSCISLQSIHIPDSVLDIESMAFFMCSQLSYVRLSSNLVSIRQGTFGCTSNLTSIKIPQSVVNIGVNAFERSGLISVYIPDNVIEISSGAFKNSLVGGFFSFSPHKTAISCYNSNELSPKVLIARTNSPVKFLNSYDTRYIVGSSKIFKLNKDQEFNLEHLDLRGKYYSENLCDLASWQF